MAAKHAATGALLGLLALSLCLGSVTAMQVAQQVQLVQTELACERITGVKNCIECTGADRACHLCQRDYNPVWTSNGMVRECRKALSGDQCIAVSGDPNCVACDGFYCVRCKPGYFFNGDFVCVPGTCPQVSHNPGCAQCNPDGSCTKCADPKHILMPFNAIHLNVPFPESQCVTRAQLDALDQAITYKTAEVPNGCVEVDSEFKCNRCQDGFSLTQGKCKPYATGSKCREGLPYRQYCAQCDLTGTRCIKCNGARSLLDGACALPCKQLFGIGCLSCTPTFCTQVDPLYINGRK